jgi:hypothetical protein
VQRRAKLVFKGQKVKFNFGKHSLHLLHHTEKANRGTNQGWRRVFFHVFSPVEAKVGTNQAEELEDVVSLASEKVGTKQDEDLEECYFACCLSCVSKGGNQAS